MGRGTSKVNDRVMQITNKYDKEVYNEDIGRIIQIDEEAQEVTVIIDDRKPTYDYSDLMNWSKPTAYPSISPWDRNTRPWLFPSSFNIISCFREI